MPSPIKNKTDFDTAELLATQHEQHEKDISDLSARIVKIEGCLGTPQALAVFLQSAAEDSRKLEEVFAKMFCHFLNEHPEVQEVVKKKFDEVDRHFIREKFKKWGSFVGTAFVFLMGAITTEIVRQFPAILHHFTK